MQSWCQGFLPHLPPRGSLSLSLLLPSLSLLLPPHFFGPVSFPKTRASLPATIFFHPTPPHLWRSCHLQPDGTLLPILGLCMEFLAFWVFISFLPGNTPPRTFSCPPKELITGLHAYLFSSTSSSSSIHLQSFTTLYFFSPSLHSSLPLPSPSPSHF